MFSFRGFKAFFVFYCGLFVFPTVFQSFASDFSWNISYNAISDLKRNQTLSEIESSSIAKSNGYFNLVSAATATTNQKLKISENNPIAALLCKGIRAFTGTVSKVLAIVLLFGLGITLLQATPMNPVSPVTVVSFIVGIGILFSAETIIGKLMGDAGYGGDASRSCDCKYGVSCV